MAALHSNFKRSYGYNYELNQDFFFQFFDGLAKYMLGQKQNLSLMIDMFFRELLVRIVRLMLLAKSESDLRTADCVAEGLEKQNPFDQTPEIVKALMSRAFPPARIAANALLLGNKMIGSLMNHTSLRLACVRHWLGLRYCSLCSAIVNAYICPYSCRLAFDSCLSSIRPLALKWASFIDRLLPVLGTLQGPTSFPQVNRPIQMHITDAIMNLQRVFSRLDHMLLANCSHHGIALSTRLRRSTLFRYPTSQALPRTDFGQPLYRIEALGDWSRKAVEKYAKFRNLFVDLPARFCTDDFLRTRRPFRASTQPCWDGEDLIDGSSFRIGTEPELLPSISSTGQDTSTGTLYHELQHMIEKLDAITRYHADPDYLLVDNSYVSKYSDTGVSWRNTPEFATTLGRGKLSVPSNVITEFLGSDGKRRGMLNMTAPFELSRLSDGSIGDHQNPIPIHEDGSGSLPSIHQTNTWTLGRESESDGYLLLSNHASDFVVRDPVSPIERHSDFAPPLGSHLDDEDTVVQPYNEPAKPNDVARGKKQTPFDSVTDVRRNQSDSSRKLPGHRSAVVSTTQIRKVQVHQHHDPPNQIWIPAKAVQTLDMHSGVPHSRRFFNSNWYFVFSILLFSL
ncbi:glypican-4 [Clonorchis sinensis]|uniref:Glypican-4 n=1 Tax=Clonorchis sinensis TaxID=79923 RepID=H2KNW9_CLOSI|nr:glypican-4 [Clonorchis sinensis]